MKSTRYQGGVELLNSSLKRENSKSTTRLVVKKKWGKSKEQIHFPQPNNKKKREKQQVKAKILVCSGKIPNIRTD